MEIKIKQPDGSWKNVELGADLLFRRSAMNRWHSFNPREQNIFSKKVSRAWEDQVSKSRYGR